jgi:hypothetical protein
MFEVWEITSGNGVGELLVAAVGDYADMPPKLRDRLRKVGNGAFETAEEANRFRQDMATRHQMDA